MSQPLRRSPSSSTVPMVTLSRGMMCCLLYFFFWMTMLPYTRMSLKRKNCRALGLLRHSFVRTPSPISTRPGMTSGWPAVPKHASTTPMRLELASLFAKRSTIFHTTEKEKEKKGLRLEQEQKLNIMAQTISAHIKRWYHTDLRKEHLWFIKSLPILCGL